MSTEQNAPVVETPKAPAMTAEQMQAELIRLRVLVDAKDKTIKVKVTDAEFKAVLARIQAANKADLETGNPKARPVLSLRTDAGEVIDLSKEQRAEWKPAKVAMEKAHSAAHRILYPQRKAILARVYRNGDATIATVHKTQKNGGEYVSISARKKGVARKGKGLKKAKPAQVAAHVPAAGNAQEPAKV